MVLDNLEVLNGQPLADLMGCIQNYWTYFETVLLVASRDKQPERIAVPTDEYKCFWVEGGEVFLMGS